MREVKGKIERYFTIQKKKKTLLLPTERGQLLSKGTKNSHRATREKKKKKTASIGRRTRKQTRQLPFPFQRPTDKCSEKNLCWYSTHFSDAPKRVFRLSA